jgi:hypothetical protein
VVRAIHFDVCLLLKGLGAPWLPSPARGKIVFSPSHLLSVSMERTAMPLHGGLTFVARYGAWRSWSLHGLAMGREGSG